MSYEVLARKLRPAGFDALVGQEHVVRALRHALDNNRLHHAYLFTGTRGVGKTTIARIVAKALNCEQGVSASPCGECSVCVEVRENRFIDLIEVDAASRTGVDDTRDLLENAQYLPTRGRYKVYLIDEVHMLSTASFNALLKTLEEPPEHVKFLLATTDPKKVPVTVLSRCLQFQLKNLSRQDIAEYLAEVLQAEAVEFEQSALEVVARAAAGSMRDALSLTDQAIAYGQGKLLQDDVSSMLGVVGRNEVDSLLGALAAGSAAGLLEITAALAERNADFADVLQGLLEALHELAVEDALGKVSAAFSAEELQLYYQIALIGHRDLSIAPDERSGFEMTLLRMLSFAPDDKSAVPAKTQSEPAGGTSPAQDATAEAAATEAATTEAGTTEAATAEATAAEAATAVAPIADAPTTPTAAPASTSTSTDAPVIDEMSERWAEITEQLAVGGVTRMIAEHANLLNMELPAVSIVLDQGHDTLLNTSQQQHLARALSELFDQPVQLHISTGEVPRETPAQRRERLARERQAEAEAQIQEDANVANLLAEFNGRVEEIRPL